MTALFEEMREREFLKLPPISTRSFRIPVRACKEEESPAEAEEEEEEEEEEEDDGGGARKLATPRKICDMSSLTPWRSAAGCGGEDEWITVRLWRLEDSGSGWLDLKSQDIFRFNFYYFFQS